MGKVKLYDQDADTPGPIMLERPLAWRLLEHMRRTAHYAGDQMQLEADMRWLASKLGS
jgi:hypothetical protein